MSLFVLSVLKGKAPGLVHFGTEPFKSSVNIKANILKEQLLSNEPIRLINCNEAECQIFLSKVIKFWDEENPSGKWVLDYTYHGGEYNFAEYYNRIEFRAHIHIFACCLDRVCIHLLAKLCGYGYLPNLSYGTKIVSFENEQDLIDCFTRLNLVYVHQSDSNDHLNKLPVSLIMRIRRDKRWLRDDKDKIRPRSDLILNKDGKLGKIEEIDFTEIDRKNVCTCADFFFSIFARKPKLLYYLPSTYLELRFFIKPDLVQIPLPRKRTRSAPTFQVEVNVKSRRDLSEITSIALQVPTLRFIKVLEGNMRVLYQKFIQALKDRPAHSHPLDVKISSYSYVPVSEELLEVFSEKKLTSMAVLLDTENRATYNMLDKVLTTISKSRYLQVLTMAMAQDTYKQEDWTQLTRFMESLASIAATMVPLLKYVHFNFRGFYCEDMKVRIKRSQNHIMKVVKLKRDKRLQTIVALVRASMFGKCETCPVSMLPVDVLRELAVFLI